MSAAKEDRVKVAFQLLCFWCRNFIKVYISAD